MTTTHYADGTGHYLGAWGDGAVPPAGAIEVPEPPSGRAMWIDGAWTWDPEGSARAALRLTPRQLFIGLAAEGWITEAEAIAAATTGALPSVAEGAIANLPATQALAARISWARLTVAERTDPLVELLRAAKGKSSAEVDAFFRQYASI